MALRDNTNPTSVPSLCFVGFDSPAHGGEYRPSPTRTDRVSLALWPHSPALDPSPLFARTPGGLTTAVIVWPVDMDGYLQDADLGRAQVSEWRFSEEVFDALKCVHERLHLGRHDVWVHGVHPIHLVPTPRSLHRLIDEHEPDLATRLRTEIEALRAQLEQKCR